MAENGKINKHFQAALCLSCPLVLCKPLVSDPPPPENSSIFLIVIIAKHIIFSNPLPFLPNTRQGKTPVTLLKTFLCTRSLDSGHTPKGQRLMRCLLRLTPEPPVQRTLQHCLLHRMSARESGQRDLGVALPAMGLLLYASHAYLLCLV